MNPFHHALHDMENAVEGVVGLSADDNKLLLNGVAVAGTVTPIQLSQPFELGGQNYIPTCEIAVSRVDFCRLGILASCDLGKNRFTVEGEVMRIISRAKDPVASRVSFMCGPINR